MNRCPWCLGDELMMRYHDVEWGVPVYDDNKQFEFLVLESSQAGLSWKTVLYKRENYRKAFAGFDPWKVSNFTEEDISRLLNNPGIIRNRKKIEAAINNAGRFLEIQEEYGSFSSYLWKFVGDKPVVDSWENDSQIPPRSELSDFISLGLKKRGFSFIGSTIMYAHLQAIGIVNDHIVSCFRYKELTSYR
ncbi:MAG: DNA-3-methyladenine glycosylase 1 [candidate division WS2 bacterium]|uniref:DNA-3-methyladenine glycosylase 1 n=1 Tax=Psychracetigena formicireducens TaxID=2986056 RepID=A0A9E2BH60_PSYF1|nr:DNA-3-methyladenine glycosylase 1 [Candidatus Psychracetigena formicireducens]MBT9145478.1 DNA-3-methyladenine glycosylase 1 [Candidatus Psychracetigena formicireducens]